MAIALCFLITARLNVDKEEINCFSEELFIIGQTKKVTKVTGKSIIYGRMNYSSISAPRLLNKKNNENPL